MLTEDEYLAIAERVERLSMGDRNVYLNDTVLLTDLIRLLADWREWQRATSDYVGLRKEPRQGHPGDQAADDQVQAPDGDKDDA